MLAVKLAALPCRTHSEADTDPGSRPVRRESEAPASPSHRDSAAGVCVFVTPAKPVPRPGLAPEVSWTITCRWLANSDFAWGFAYTARPSPPGS